MSTSDGEAISVSWWNGHEVPGPSQGRPAVFVAGDQQGDRLVMQVLGRQRRAGPSGGHDDLRLVPSSICQIFNRRNCQVFGRR